MYSVQYQPAVAEIKREGLEVFVPTIVLLTIDTESGKVLSSSLHWQGETRMSHYQAMQVASAKLREMQK